MVLDFCVLAEMVNFGAKSNFLEKSCIIVQWNFSYLALRSDLNFFQFFVYTVYIHIYIYIDIYEYIYIYNILLYIYIYIYIHIYCFIFCHPRNFLGKSGRKRAECLC